MDLLQSYYREYRYTSVAGDLPVSTITKSATEVVWCSFVGLHKCRRPSSSGGRLHLVAPVPWLQLYSMLSAANAPGALP